MHRALPVERPYSGHSAGGGLRLMSIAPSCDVPTRSHSLSSLVSVCTVVCVCTLYVGSEDRCPCTHSTLGPARIGILYDMRHGLIVMSCKCNYTLPPTAPSKRVRPSGDRGRLRTASGRLLDGVGWWASALCGGAASRPGGSPRCGRTMQRSAGRVPSSTSMYCWPAACTDGRPSSAGRRLVQQWVGVEVRRVANGKAVSGERPRLGRRRYGAGSDVTAPRLWRRCR